MISSQINKADTPPTVVVGLDHYLGLQTARILSRRGVPVIAVARDPRHFCCRTNVCEQILYADILSEEIVPFLISLGKQLPQKAVLYPCRDVTVLLISRNREKLNPFFHIALPSKETVELLMDKIKFYQYALEEQLPIPKTKLIYNEADACSAARELTYPCTLKPPIKTPLWEEHTQIKAFKISNREEFLETYQRCAAWSEVFIAQEWVKGADSNCYACNCYFSKSAEPLVTFICKSIRKWIPETGNTSLGVECKNPVLLKESIGLFKNVRFHGLGYLEMKKDDRSGKFYIIEPNIGRPTGKSALAEASGVELLYTMYCDLTGRPLPRSRQQTYRGMKWIYFRQDVQSAFQYWRRGELTFTEWRNSLRGPKFYAVLSWSDPWPFLEDFRARIRANLSKLLRKIFPSARAKQRDQQEGY